MCKLSHYGNCDRETKDNEYCIFHKPNKNEEEAREFYEKFLKKFKHRKEKIKDKFGEEITRYVFKENMNCRKFVFPEIPEDMDFIFRHAIFEGEADFRETKFEGSVRFTGTEFRNDVDFSGCKFRGNTYFDHTRFFGYYTAFKEVEFEKDTLFTESEFSGVADFEEATFGGNTYFSYAKLGLIAIFERVRFESNVYFMGTGFEGDAFFDMATFMEGAIFTELYEGMDGKPCKFKGRLHFSNTFFGRNIILDIPSGYFELPHAEAEARRVQRLSYEKEGKRDDADRMFLLERRALRRARVMDAKERIKEIKREESGKPEIFKAWMKYIYENLRAGVEYLIADFTCKYGTSWRRAILLWVAVVIGFFPLLYFVFNGVKVDAWWDYIYFSVVTATTLGYGDFHPIGIGKLFASGEAIFGTFMWAVYIAVFARKYMR